MRKIRESFYIKEWLRKKEGNLPMILISMRLCHPPEGSTSANYKLLCFITTKKNLQREECTSFYPG
jgi:hypothetical protein